MAKKKSGSKKADAPQDKKDGSGGAAKAPQGGKGSKPSKGS
jgi:hypothetical protein